MNGCLNMASCHIQEFQMLLKVEGAYILLRLSSRSAPLRLPISLFYFAALAVVLVAGLEPFNFHPKNQVSWMKGRNGIQLGGRGMILGAFDLPRAADSVGSRQPITIELFIRSFIEPKDSLPQFFTALDENSEEDFFIGQWKAELVVRSRMRGRTSASRYREIGVRGDFSRGKEQLVAIASGNPGTIVYLDGSPAKILPRFFLFPPDKAGQETLLLGNSSTGKAGMKGMISGLAIYDRMLTAVQIDRSFDAWKKEGRTILEKDEGLTALYLFDERSGNIIRNHESQGHDLAIPAAFKPLRRAMLDFSWKRVGLNRGFLSDAAINIGGFIVFGFVQGMFLLSSPHMRPKLALLLTLISGSVLSLIIEVTQVCLPTRDSDFIDWICNTLGTLVAVIILHRWYKPVPAVVTKNP
jgi:hypothetical protein